jgi:hypothetical protein
MNQESKKTLRFTFTGTITVEQEIFKQLIAQFITRQPQIALAQYTPPGEADYLQILHVTARRSPIRA